MAVVAYKIKLYAKMCVCIGGKEKEKGKRIRRGGRWRNVIRVWFPDLLNFPGLGAQAKHGTCVSDNPRPTSALLDASGSDDLTVNTSSR